MKLIYFFIFLICINSVFASGFGVSPTKLSINENADFYVINSNDYDTKFVIHVPDIVEVNKKEFVLGSHDKEKIEVMVIKSGKGNIEITSESNFISPGLIIPVNVELNEINQSFDFYIEKNQKNGFFVIFLINLVGAIILGIIKWKKKRS